ncbi:MAG TPA: response regulator transcription factor [Acidobacteriota bacterium]|nr:response regulator transcription factor [Acidobacteriota bacterium]
MEIGVLVVSQRDILGDDQAGNGEGRSGIKSVGAAVDGRSAVQLVWGLEPDVVILDTTVSGLNTAEVCQQILEVKARSKIIVLTEASSSEAIIQGLLAGIWGYLPIDPDPEEVRTAVQAVVANRIYISPRSVFSRIPSRSQAMSGTEAPPPSVLTDRERQVLKQLADGQSTRQMAGTLGISEKTVETHRARISTKLNLRGVAELTKYAVRHHLTSAEI